MMKSGIALRKPSDILMISGFDENFNRWFQTAQARTHRPLRSGTAAQENNERGMTMKITSIDVFDFSKCLNY